MDDLDLGATIKGFIPGQKLFNRYTLTRILGRGGMGVVWLARDEELERNVALKFLPEVVALDKEAVRDLKRETRRSLELTHPHIVRIYDFIQDARTAAISMEYVAGETLATKKVDQASGHFEVAALCEWVRQWLEAMEYAHAEAKVAHRDLKPANLMIDGQGRLKVADFGIAASMGETASRVSNQFGSSGTPVYMSPQQMMGERPAVTDDIYAIGATLYELLTGKPPFYSGNVLMQVQNKVPPTVTERRAELGVTGEPIPPEWEATIAACLAKEPQDRPQSAGEVLERLNYTTKSTKITKPEPEAGSERPPSPRLGRTGPAGRDEDNPPAALPGQSKIENRKSKIIAAMAAIAAVAAAGWWFGIHAPEQRRVEQVRMERERAESEARRLADEREAETRRIDAARIAAAEEAERQRIADEQARLAAARGGVVVRTTPAGAEVRVGAVALEKSPLTLRDLRLGNYPVRVRLEGYEDWDGEIAVKENEFAELNVALVRSTGTVTLATEPAGLDYALRGEVTRTGRTPAELTLPTGRYDITFSRPGWPEQKRMIEITRNQTAQEAAEFVPGSLELVSTPSGAEVWQGGKQVGTTPYRLAETLPGLYDYELRLRGYQPTIASLNVGPRQAARESVRLEEWLSPRPGQPFENSLGMKFVPVPGMSVLFSIWQTRVKDYQQFVSETGREWPQLPFSQGPDHPAVKIMSVDDAVSFCRWLTEKERREGQLGPGQEYRLPTQAEWDVAVGPDEFPWGSQWPPPRGAGNYSQSLNVDSYEYTSPVGSFAANRYGLYDMGGNVWELMSDRRGGLLWTQVRGASFLDYNRSTLVSSGRSPDVLAAGVNTGFRVVVAVGASGPQLVRETVILDNQASLQTEGQELLPGILVAALDESLRRQHGLPLSENTGLVILESAGRHAQLLPVGSILKEVNRVAVVDVYGAKQNLRPGRNLALLWTKGSYRYVPFEVDAGSLQ